MNKAYIILAHRNMEQLSRLVRRLDDDHSYFFIHIDARLPDNELGALQINQDRTLLLDRMESTWAGFALVKVTLNALEAIKATNREYSTISLLSGEDYPIKTNSEIDEFFANNPQKIFLEYYELPNTEKWSPRGGMYRIDKYFFGLKDYQLFGSRAVNFMGNIFPVLKRRQLLNFKPYAGSQWWTIDMYALHYILNFLKAFPEFSAFHKATFAPDEVFFHTILLNATDPRVRSSIVNDNKRFIRWKTLSMSHPEFLKKEDMEDILKSDALFARKLDLSMNPELFNVIDHLCLHKKTVAA